MLLECKECGLPISDKALTCPHCGYPLNGQTKKSQNKGHKRLPNGFGRITKINKNVRKPYRAMITVGKDEYGKPIGKLLKPEAYFKTYNEAYKALVAYHENPYNLDSKIITMHDLYDEWFNQLDTRSDTYKRTVKSAWDKCKKLYNMPVIDIRAAHMKCCIDECASPNMKRRVKSLLNLMLDYAVENEIVHSNKARTFKVTEDVLMQCEDQKRSHMPFTESEMKVLWEHVDDYYVKMMIIQCYSGFRPTELCELKNISINLDERIMIGGCKTKAGTNRIVPIHKKIYPLLCSLKSNEEYVFQCIDTVRTDKRLTYDKYKKRFDRTISALGLNTEHCPHDCRKHFITQCKKYNVDEYAIKRIVGHEINDLTEKVYTERSTEWLLEEINKIES